MSEKKKKLEETQKKLVDKIKDLKEEVIDIKGNKDNKEQVDKMKKALIKDIDEFLGDLDDLKGLSLTGGNKALRRKIKFFKADLGRIKTESRKRVIKAESEEEEGRIFNLEDAFRLYLAKYQIVGFLEEYFKEFPEDEPPKIESFLRRTKDRLIDYIFDTIEEENIPKNLSYYDKFPRPSNIPKQIERKTGLLQLTDEEAEELINRQDYSHIYEGKNPLGKFAGQSKITLLEHQRKFLNGFFLGNLRSAVVFHGVGTGKTFTAVASVKLYLQLYPKGKVMIITPPAVLFNFIDSMIEYGINPQDRRFTFMSFDKFSRNKNIDTTDTLLIIDEAHNLRTEIVGDVVEREDKAIMGSKYTFNMKQVFKGRRPAAFIVKGFNARKIIMLTATPFVNTPYDIENLIKIGESDVPLNKKYFGEMVSGADFRYDYFKYRISKYDRNFKKGDFPEMRERYIHIKAPTEDKSIQALAGDKNPFYSFSRQKGLVMEKIDYCIDIIKKNPNKKFVIYSAYVFQGINKIEKTLQKNGIEYGFITGGMNTKQIARFIDGYNNYNNPNYPIDKIRVLLISKAGSEGVNLLETRGIFVIDGVWNEALYEQVVARAVRFKSHKNLPENEQYVDVYKIFYSYEFEEPFIKRLDDGKGFDFQKFYNAFQALKKKMKEMRKQAALADNSAETILKSVDKKGVTQKNILEIAQQSGNFKAEELKKLKKGSKERQDYLKKNLEFGKNKAKYEANEALQALENKIPSTDFYMFVLQKIKDNKIQRFIKEIIKIPMVENTIEDNAESKKLLDELQEGKLTDQEIIENLISGLVGKEEQFQEILKKGARSGENNLQKLILKSQELKILSQQKAKARLRQEFFTPNDLVKKMIEKSGMDKLEKYESIKFLEGSAGWGNIVNGVLSVCSKRKVNIKCDMVEIVEENRKELEKLVKLLPQSVDLKKERNFLLYTPSVKYDYILMNPPFFLQQRFNKEYTRDIYDYDFLMRAYSMLDLNGVLVFITGMKWKQNETIKKFYKDIDADIEELKNVVWKGAEVKAGGEVEKLDISLIYVKKLVENSKLDNDLLQMSNKLFVDIDAAIQNKKPTIQEEEGGGGAAADRQEIKRDEKEDLRIFDLYYKIREDWLKNDKPFPMFICNAWIENFIYQYILKRHQNDCEYDIPSRYGSSVLVIGRAESKKNKEIILRKNNNYYSNFRRITEEHKINTNNKFVGGFDYEWVNDGGFQKLIDKFRLCRKNNLILAIPLTIGSDGGHANLILINPFTNTFERYEPHGTKTGGTELDMKKYDDKYYNEILKKLVEIMNKEDDINLKYYSPEYTCPITPKGYKLKRPQQAENKEDAERILGVELKYKKVTDKKRIRKEYDGLQTEILYRKSDRVLVGFKNKKTRGKYYLYSKKEVEEIPVGFQSIESREKKDIKEALYESIVYKEVGGYCCMWSFFIMDVRLYYPKEDPQKTLSRALKLLKGPNNENRLTDFIRGFTQVIMDDLNKHLGGDFFNKFVRGAYGKKTEAKKAIKKQLNERIKKIVLERKKISKQKLK